MISKFNFELTINIMYIEKGFISGIDKMQYFLFKDIEYKGYLRSLKRISIDICKYKKM
jgi:hypothetical protein